MMDIKKVIDMEHSFNGHDKFKLITCLAIKRGFMGLTSSTTKRRILYKFDSKIDKKGEAKMYFLDGDGEIEKQLTNTEYNEIAKLTQEYHLSQEAKENITE